MRASENSSATRARARRSRSRAASGCSSTQPIARLSAAESRGGTRSPSTPSSSASGLPPTRVATTGAPAAIDSRIVLERPSLSDGSTDTETAGPALELAPVPAPVGIDVVADDEEVRLPEALGDRGRRVQEVLHALQAA